MAYADDPKFDPLPDRKPAFGWLFRSYSDGTKGVKPGSAVLAAIAAILGLAIVFGAFYNVGAGERAAEFSRSDGVKEENVDEGLHFKIPLWETAHVYNVKQQKYEVDIVGASKDSQDVSVTMVVRYHLDPQWVWWMHQNVGRGYEDVVLRPVAVEAVKKASAQFPVLDILPQRADVEALAFVFMQPALGENHVILDGIELVNIDFSPSVRKALEDKEVARQEAIRQLNLLDARRAEANQTIARANGEAEAARIISEQLAQNPAYIQYLWVQKWNGVMPNVVGSGDTSILVPVNTQPSSQVQSQAATTTVARSDASVGPPLLVAVAGALALALERRHRR